MGELCTLRGLGPKSEKSLNEIGIYTRADLARIGPVRAFIMVRQVASTPPSLNFLYAMAGALEDRSWTEIARTERGRLLLELEALLEDEASHKTSEA